MLISVWSFSGDSDGKESACNVGNLGSVPGLGISPGEGNDYLFRSVWTMYMYIYSVPKWCLILCDPMDCRPPGSSVHVDSPGNNIGVGCHALFQGIFPSHGSNL